MKRVSLQQLSDLVLVDILAAVPMCAAVRLAQLGHQRLQAISCRPWVLKRMADVNFPAAVKAYQAGGRVREAFCSEAVLRRLYGRLDVLPYESRPTFWSKEYLSVDILPYESRPTLLREAIVNIISEMPGPIHCKVSDNNSLRFLEFDTPLNVRRKLQYITNTSYRRIRGKFSRFPNLAVLYFNSCFTDDDWFKRESFWQYRPALLNGRHPVDVLRAVCGPAVVSEAELDRVRRQATEGAICLQQVLGIEQWQGVWGTGWLGKIC